MPTTQRVIDVMISEVQAAGDRMVAEFWRGLMGERGNYGIETNGQAGAVVGGLDEEVQFDQQPAIAGQPAIEARGTAWDGAERPTPGGPPAY